MALEICPRQPKRLRREQSEGSPSLFCWAIQGYAEPPDCDRVRKVKKSYSYFHDNLFWQNASPVFELQRARRGLRTWPRAAHEGRVQRPRRELKPLGPAFPHPCRTTQPWRQNKIL